MLRIARRSALAADAIRNAAAPDLLGIGGASAATARTINVKSSAQEHKHANPFIGRTFAAADSWRFCDNGYSDKTCSKDGARRRLD